MHINLSGKTAIITASTAGISLATAKGLAAAGASVIVNGCTREGVDRTVKAVGAVGQGAKWPTLSRTSRMHAAATFWSRTPPPIGGESWSAAATAAPAPLGGAL